MCWLHVCACVCTGVCICVYVCIYVCVCVYILVCVYACVHAYTCSCVYVCAYVCMYVCVCVYIYIYLCVSLCVHASCGCSCRQRIILGFISQVSTCFRRQGKLPGNEAQKEFPCLCLAAAAGITSMLLLTWLFLHGFWGSNPSPRAFKESTS